MAGRFKKAPLVYVTAHIRTTPLPQLSSDQAAIVQQAMMKCGLVVFETSQSQIVDISQLAAIGSGEQKFGGNKLSTIQRHGYFSADRTECLILDGSVIEWRASKYTKYDAFVSTFEKAIQALLDVVDVFGCLVTQEFVLSYADVIAPENERSLSEYFSASDNILPLSFLDNQNKDLQQVGHVQVTRVTSPSEKITISLEQLPVKERAIQKFLPEILREADRSFAMPLPIQEGWADLSSRDYGLLMTQAAMLKKTSLNDFRCSSAFEPLHALTRETFRSLIDRSVCDKDWSYESSEGGTNAS